VPELKRGAGFAEYFVELICLHIRHAEVGRNLREEIRNQCCLSFQDAKGGFTGDVTRKEGDGDQVIGRRRRN
jgi:hypothetical protein